MNSITKIGDNTRGEVLSEVIEMLLNLVKDKLGEGFDINKVEESLTELFRVIRKNETEDIFKSKDVKHIECKECGYTMESRGHVSRKIKGLADYELPMRLFYCDKCKGYEKALEDVIGCRGRNTLELNEAMLLLGQRLPFEESSGFMEKLLGVKVSHESIQELVEGVGKEIWKEEINLVRSNPTTTV
ncbi:MAG: hypothetical protein HQL06_16940 [Nitrospirae bacterium]|nr:hypothetical protein [Nitrospirota bacterium]